MEQWSVRITGTGPCGVLVLAGSDRRQYNWYAPSSNWKLLFDRLVCMNGGNPREDLIDHKDPERAMALERSPEWEHLHVNHLEGRSGASSATEMAARTR